MPQYCDQTKEMKVRTTAYHAKEWDHKKYKTKSAAGTELKYGEVRSAAADWSRYPLGTKFKIDGLPFTYVVDDYGSALVGTNTIDLYKMSAKEMRWWGVRKVDIKILEWGDYEKSEEILKGRRKYRHCRQMHDALKKRLSSAADLPTDA
ncbi:3D domain-containing protein [Sulfuriroseicoccus oceanibius]|uniref:3D domain-containing protein n=2 Tax=Sulfuriroseicoccus oceanibius TaxID=2707525 RepID=A0A6B3L0X7_9BACT|nr:3D domain-containing protein [Sulfuriroseicoccus oceanibius]